MVQQSGVLLLGSRSPRRSEILSTLGIVYEVLAADIDEGELPSEGPTAYLERIVSKKLEAVREQALEREGAGCLVADTVVVLDGEILGKPSSPQRALTMLESLAGRTHQVMTRYAVETRVGARCERTVSTDVTFRAATREELLRYVETGEGEDKAGSYAVQGRGAFLVESLRGSYMNVVGLPACELVLDLQKLAILRSYP